MSPATRTKKKKVKNNDEQPQPQLTSTTTTTRAADRQEEEEEQNVASSSTTTNTRRRDHHYHYKLDAAWNGYITQLTDYRQKYGTVNVKRNCKDFPDLARWVENVRRRSTTSLSDAQKRQLDALGFIWERANLQRYHRQWEGMYQRLVDYKRRHGDTIVPTDYKEDTALGNWVKNQRATWRKGTLRSERKEVLDGLGFCWEIAPLKQRRRTPSHEMESLWRQKYYLLQLFQNEHGHCRVPLTYQENQKLGDWVNNQRIAFAENRMREDRKQQLDAIGFCWKPSIERQKYGNHNNNDVDVDVDASSQKKKKKRLMEREQEANQCPNVDAAIDSSNQHTSTAAAAAAIEQSQDQSTSVEIDKQEKRGGREGKRRRKDSRQQRQIEDNYMAMEQSVDADKEEEELGDREGKRRRKKEKKKKKKKRKKSHDKARRREMFEV